MIALLFAVVALFCFTLIAVIYIYEKERQRLLAAMLQKDFGSKVAAHVSDKPIPIANSKRPLS